METILLHGHSLTLDRSRHRIHFGTLTASESHTPQLLLPFDAPVSAMAVLETKPLSLVAVGLENTQLHIASIAEPHRSQCLGSLSPLEWPVSIAFLQSESILAVLSSSGSVKLFRLICSDWNNPFDAMQLVDCSDSSNLGRTYELGTKRPLTPTAPVPPAQRASTQKAERRFHVFQHALRVASGEVARFYSSDVIYPQVSPPSPKRPRALANAGANTNMGAGNAKKAKLPVTAKRSAAAAELEEGEEEDGEIME
ncbi:hypothetical protein HDU78_008760 [Chytriomyces hyalinus]|nr:hypothetical protein HDU78_008760 [Chytriomyces hyalinus]KAJ3263106.1 hypothetical protein HDU77_011289 [Chytriomyces hyalinus]